MDLERSSSNDEDDVSRRGYLSDDEEVTDCGFADTSRKTKEDSTPEIAQEDSERVWWLRVLVIAVLVVATVAIAIPVHKRTQDSEVRAYEAEFTEFASKIIDTYYRSIEDNMWTAYSLSVTLTSDTQRANSTWPGITIPDFETRTFGASKIVNGAILFAPLLTNLSRAEWEEYAIDNAYQLDSQLADDPNCKDPGFVDEFGSCRKISDGIFKLDGHYLVDQTEQAMYSPLWQVSSGVKAEYSAMFDQMSEPIQNRSLLDMIENRVPVVSDVIYAGHDGDHEELQCEPRSLLFFPVFEFIGDGSRVVGSISIDFEWKSYFAFSLKHSGSVDVVLMNVAANQYFTFQVKGNEVSFVAEGDHHDPRYDDILMVESSLDAFDNLGIAIKVEYLVRVYPTRSFEDEYITNHPALFAGFVVMAFFIAGVAFLLYDHVVRRRQRVVLASAEQTTKIVDSLFPKQIQKRMFKTSEMGNEASKDTNGLFWRVGGSRASSNQQKKKTAIPHNFNSAVSVRLRSFLDSSPSSHLASDFWGTDPIADLFPETTILFADISGFTAWSSEREPQQIFLLLETLYQAFDQIASRLGVFKVETIGDCCKFTIDCV
jgi:Adenylate and Guanylate cyclase catalytic domain